MGKLTFSRGLLGSELATPWPLDRNKTRGGSYGNHTSFDTNMVIILAALLFTLIGVLGLNSIVRCAMRCTRRFSGVTPAARAADTGLKTGALGEIPVVVYGSAVADSRGSDGECPICLGEFEEGEEVRVLPKCSHSFHVSCIDAWLVSRTSCPVCRDSLLEFPVKMEVAGAQSPENGSDHLGSVAVVAEEGTH